MCSTSLVNAQAYVSANNQCSVLIGDFNDEGKAEISGKFTTAQAGEYVTVAIFAPDMDQSDLIPGSNQNSILPYTGRAKSDANGEFTIEITLTGASGEYSAYFGPAVDGETLARIPIYYSNKTENVSKLTELNIKAAAVGINSATNAYIAADVTDVENFVDTNKDALAFRFSLYEGANTVNHTEVIKTLIRHLKDEPFDTNNRDEASGIFRTLVFMRALSEDKVASLDTYAEYLPIFTDENGILKGWYDEASAEEKSEIISRLKSLSYQTLEGFEKKAVEMAILTRIHHADGDGEVRQMLTNFESYTNIATSGLRQGVYDGLERQNYADYAALSAAITNLKKTTTPVVDTQGGGGGGGGGSMPTFSADSEKNSEIQPQPIVEEKDGFDDVSETDWYYDAVYELADRGIISGKSENSFAPNESITREEIVKMLAVMENLTLDESDEIFTDVGKNDWFCKYVNAAAKYGIVKGIGDGVFGTGKNVTRQEIAVMLYNIAIKNGVAMPEKTDETEFTDADMISAYAADAIKMLSNLKIINGYDDGSFKPTRNVSRAEAAKLIREFIYINQ